MTSDSDLDTETAVAAIGELLRAAEWMTAEERASVLDDLRDTAVRDAMRRGNHNRAARRQLQRRSKKRTGYTR